MTSNTNIKGVVPEWSSSEDGIGSGDCISIGIGIGIGDGYGIGFGIGSGYGYGDGYGYGIGDGDGYGYGDGYGDGYGSGSKQPTCTECSIPFPEHSSECNAVLISYCNAMSQISS